MNGHGGSNRSASTLQGSAWPTHYIPVYASGKKPYINTSKHKEPDNVCNGVKTGPIGSQAGAISQVLLAFEVLLAFYFLIQLLS